MTHVWPYGSIFNLFSDLKLGIRITQVTDNNLIAFSPTPFVSQTIGFSKVKDVVVVVVVVFAFIAREKGN